MLMALDKFLEQFYWTISECETFTIRCVENNSITIGRIKAECGDTSGDVNRKFKVTRVVACEIRTILREARSYKNRSGDVVIKLPESDCDIFRFEILYYPIKNHKMRKLACVIV